MKLNNDVASWHLFSAASESIANHHLQNISEVGRKECLPHDVSQEQVEVDKQG